jgi:hypothetical protein
MSLTHKDILDQYHQGVLRDALELSERTRMSPDECVVYVLPFHARVAEAVFDLMLAEQRGMSANTQGEVKSNNDENNRLPE